jgi:putative PIN family toxin of toxin-antitoxin system
MLRVAVFDTNILLSALFSLHGNAFRCLALAKMGVVQSVTCQEILQEFQEKLEGKFSYSAQRACAAVDEVQQCSRLVTITHNLKVVVADPDDDKIVECAVVGGATHIVTGDRRHLLPMGSYQGISIISPADFLQLLSQL